MKKRILEEIKKQIEKVDERLERFEDRSNCLSYLMGRIYGLKTAENIFKENKENEDKEEGLKDKVLREIQNWREQNAGMEANIITNSQIQELINKLSGFEEENG